MATRIKILTSILTAILIGTTSCSDTDNDNTGNESLVVEGWIANNEHPIVLLSTSVSVTDQKQSISSLSDHIQRWAKVTISDGDTTVTLMGKYDKRYMPPYIYTTTDLVGEIGKTYHLYIDTDKHHAEAITTIPHPTYLTNLIIGDQCYAEFVNPHKDNYYVLLYKLGRNAQQYSLSTMGVFDNTMINGDTIRYPINMHSNIVHEEEDLPLNTPYYLRVRLACIDHNSYLFWHDFQDVYSMADNFLMPYTGKIRSSIQGATGYWAGMGVSDKETFIIFSKNFIYNNLIMPNY